MQQLYKAEPGLHGTKQRQHGRAGRDTVVLVPVGTVVHRVAQPGSAAAAGAANFGGRAQQQRQQSVHGQGQAGGEQEEEEELPEWIRRWQRPFTGADYSSDSGGEEEESQAAAGSGGGRTSGAAAVAAAGAPPGRAAASGQWCDQQHQQQQEEQQYEVLADLVEDEQEVVVAQGGPAGRGNAAIKARAHRPAPGESEVGGCSGLASCVALACLLVAFRGVMPCEGGLFCCFLHSRCDASPSPPLPCRPPVCVPLLCRGGSLGRSPSCCWS